MNNEFLLLYNKDGIAYPIAMTEQDMLMLDMFCRGLFRPEIKLINQPMGKIENLLDKKSDSAGKQ